VAKTGKFLKSLVKSAISTDGKKASALPKTLLFGGLAALVAFFFSLKLLFARRKAAALAHKVVLLEEEKRAAESLRKETKLKDSRATLAVFIAAYKKEIADRKAQIRAAEKASKEFSKQLSEVQSWDGIKIKSKVSKKSSKK